MSSEIDEGATKALHDSVPFTNVVGVELITSAPEEVRGRLAWHASRCTAGGVMHGGSLMTLADTCGAMCAFLNLPEGSVGTSTIEMKINFFRAVRAGHVEARTRPLHAGKMTVVVETDLFDSDQRHVARVSQTQAVLYPPREQPGSSG